MFYLLPQGQLSLRAGQAAVTMTTLLDLLDFLPLLRLPSLLLPPFSTLIIL